MPRKTGWYSLKTLQRAQASLSSDFISFREFQRRANLDHITGLRYLDYLVGQGLAESARQGKGRMAKRLYRMKKKTEASL